MSHMFVPGPVDVADEVLQAQAAPMLPHRSKQFEATFREHARASRAKEGCMFFYLIRDRDNPAHFATMECWDTYAHFEQHVADD